VIAASTSLLVFATETNYQTMQLVSALDLAVKNRESRMRAIGGNLNMRSPRARTL
jgi:hypothetical protein